MKKAGTSPIGKRIAALVAFCVLSSIFFISSALVYFQVSDSIISKKESLRETAIIYAAVISENLVSGEKSKALTGLTSISRIPGVLYAAALDSQDHVFASMGNTTFLHSDLMEEDQGFISVMTKGAFPVAVDVVRGGKPVGRLVLIADIRPLRTKLFWTVVITAMAAVGASIFGVLIAIPLQNRITAPIVALTKAMRSIGKSRDYSTKVEHQANDETGELVASFNSMISEIRFRDASLERLAFFDPLTGLSNRQHFHKVFDEFLESIKAGERVAALFLLDLDDFKNINDAFGHSIGDALLMNVAAIIKGEFGGGICIARLGGDEFAIIVEGIGSEGEAQDKLAPLVATLYQPVKILEQDIHVSTSVGIALYPRDGNLPGDLLRRADLALYSAKRQGPAHVHFFHPSMDAMVQEHAEIAQSLRQALAGNEFETYYQPQVNLKTGAISGLESLIRWKHRERGYVSPSVFVPIAESAGLISGIGNWVLQDSCRKGRAWLEEGNEPREISVNISVAQVLRADFLQDVQKVLEQSGFPAGLLCLEITESLFIGKTVGRVRAMLDKLKRLGVKLALDDFGTGYSSLSYLEKLPFDKLKIDRAFVSGIEADRKKRELLKGIITLAHTIGMEVVAEGAETLAELEVLMELNADHAQGYVLSRPMPASEVGLAAQAIAEIFSRRLCAKII